MRFFPAASRESLAQEGDLQSVGITRCGRVAEEHIGAVV